MPERVWTSRSRLKAGFPAVAFFAGFFWDAFTLGNSISHLDLWILFIYLFVAACILIVLGRREETQGAIVEKENGFSLPPSRIQKITQWLKTDGLLFGLQFCYGSLFSALVIFYFLSSSYLPGYFIVIALATLLCVNEFLESQYHRFTLTWTLYGLSSILYLNFALPHLFHSISSIWFYVSTAMGVSTVFLLKKYSPKAKGALWPSILMGVVLCLLYLGNAIPPVPLVKKEMIICRDLVKKDGIYTAKIEQPQPWFFWRRSESLARLHSGEKLFCFTSIFLPAGIDFTLYHKWMYYDNHKKRWVKSSRVGFPIRGGRQNGYRGYTFKQNISAGRWQVNVETENGRVLGTTHFDVEAITDYPINFKYLTLK